MYDKVTMLIVDRFIPQVVELPTSAVSPTGPSTYSAHSSAPRSVVRSSSSTSSSASSQDKYFYRDKLVFDPDVYINNPSYSGCYLPADALM
jgi:hypothetical protein